MPFELKLTARLKAEQWKVKIFEKETREPPHVTVIRKARKWRIGLRELDFLVPPGGAWKDLDPELVEILQANWLILRAAWDAKYPENPISSQSTEGPSDGKSKSS